MMQAVPAAPTRSYDLGIAVFCQNEAVRIGACLGSIAAAASGLRVTCTVIVNGSSDGSAQLAAQALARLDLPGCVYTIRFGDKSNAINHSLYALRPAARHYVFVDGYATLDTHALDGLLNTLEAHSHANAAAGVPGNGRTASTIRADTLASNGRLNGQLYALRGAFVDRLTSAGLRLPLRLYRGDGLLGSMLCLDLDAQANRWDGTRIAGCTAASFGIASLSYWKPTDIRRQFRRSIRQMRGVLENAAIKSVIKHDGYAGLPADADDMIAAWLAEGGRPTVALIDRGFMVMALRHHAASLRERPLDDDLQCRLVEEI